MKTRLQEIYNYCFSDYANIDNCIKNTPVAQQPKQKARKITAIKNIFMEEKSPLISKYRQDNFRIALRHIRAKSLESVLFGDYTTPLEKKSYPWPDDSDIELQFHRFENEYHFFDGQEQKQALEKFTHFFKFFKLVGDFIEWNNDANNTEAYLRAYKMLVIFGSENDPKKYFQEFDKYIKTHNFFEKANPVHNTLIWNLPKIKPPNKIHLQNWRPLIQAGGNKAFRLFNLAHEIEKKLGRAPKDIKEAQVIALALTYKKAKLDPELAELCLTYGVPEETFNRCLELKLKIKKSDNLPNIIIDGNDVGKPGYYLVKLPINDPKAFILGQITNCCQSIGGETERCVIDGLTRPNNGFYVLLKAPGAKQSRALNDEKSILIEADIKQDLKEEKPISIDLEVKKLIQKCKLVGQGYAWISRNGNLTIDSWENLNPDAENAVIIPMLQLFGKKVTELKDSLIGRVTIGTGGKTPRSFDKQALSPEIPLEGYHCYDSVNQYVVYSNENKLQNINHLFKKYKEEFELALKKNLPYDEKHNSKEQLKVINHIFFQEDLFSISEENRNKLYALIKNSKLISYLTKKDKFAILLKVIKYENICKMLGVAYDPLINSLLKAPQDKNGELKNISTIIKNLLANHIKNKNHLFLRSVQCSHIDAFNELLEEKPNVNARFDRDSSTCTPLECAIERHNVQMVNHLLKAKANVNATLTLDKSPLLKAIIYSESKILMRTLLDARANVNAGDNLKYTPLHKALQKNRDIEIIRWLLEEKAKPNLIDHLGNTPLHYAAENGNLESIKLLLNNNFNLNIKNNENENAFLLAIENNHMEAAKLLLAAKSEINIKNKCGFTPLHYLAETSNVEFIKILLEAKANPNEKSKLFGTPLTQAASHDQWEVVKLLLSLKADVNASGTFGHSSLHSTIHNIEQLKILIKAKANVNLIDDRGNTPLVAALDHNNNVDVDVVSLLIESKSDCNIQNKEGETASHFLAKKNNLELLKLLINSKADLNKTNKQALTPLHYLKSSDRADLQLKPLSSAHVTWLHSQINKITQHEEKSSVIKISKLQQDLEDILEEKSSDNLKFFNIVELLTKTVDKSVKYFESLNSPMKKTLLANNPYDDFFCNAIVNLLRNINNHLTLVPFDFPSSKFKVLEKEMFDQLPQIKFGP